MLALFYPKIGFSVNDFVEKHETNSQQHKNVLNIPKIGTVTQNRVATFLDHLTGIILIIYQKSVTGKIMFYS